MIGTVDTVPAGQPAVVNNSGNEENVVLDFVIPRGATGATGPKGQDATFKAAAAVADATDEQDVVNQFNQLLGNLRAAGLLEE